jgi:hypothetical protein
MESVRSRMAKKLKGIDRFAQKISLTFNKSDNFETIVGGIGTLIMYSIVMLVGVVLFIEMFQRTNINATQTFIYRNLDFSTDKYQVGKNGVAFAFRVQHSNGTIADESIGKFRVEELAMVGFSDNSVLQRNYTTKNIEVEPCNAESDFSKIKLRGVNSQIKCFKHNNYSIGGSDYSYEQYALNIFFEKCTGLF